jgi:succinate dehydrogenase / fumarate reductase membrane anchor subunit
MNQKTSSATAYSWFIQRITGILLAFFVIVHLNVLHFGEKWLIDFNFVSQRLQSSAWWVLFYLFFVPVVLFHGLNGLWGVIQDYRPNPGAEKAVKTVLWILGIVATIYGYLAMRPFL